MTDGTSTVDVHAWLTTRNLWEYYIMEGAPNDDIRFALVYGDETEMGDVSMSEIAPYVVASTADLSEVAPAPGWSWVE